MSVTSEKHRAELQRFRELLSKAAYQTQWAPAAGDVLFDTLLVKIESFEKQNRVWILELSYLPGLEAELEDVSILQCYVTVSDQVPAEYPAGLERLMGQLNANLPLGSFGLLDHPRVLFFKHNALLPTHDLAASDRIVHELIQMTSYLLSIFSDSLVKVATGKQPADAALASLPFGNVIG